jgi:predicted dehydrogenase
MNKYSVLIIGAGKIGAFFDSPKNEKVLTHAHAFSIHPGFRLLGFVDSDIEQAKRATCLWGGETFTSVADAFSRYVIDVAVIAVPDEFHYKLLKELSSYSPRLVFVEKPLTKTVAEAEEIISVYRDRQINLGLNYTRRFVPEFINLKEEIASGIYGNFLTGTGYYGKGTLHNGSHLIDLLRFLLGEITEARTISQVYDFYDDDPSRSAVLDMAKGGQFIMQALDCRSYTIFEMDMLFEKKRVRIIDSGFRIEFYRASESGIFAGYQYLYLENIMETGLSLALSHTAEAVYRHLVSETALCCTGVDGMQALKICSIINSNLIQV